MLAEYVFRRWKSARERQKDPQKTVDRAARTVDLARGLLQRFDRERMDAPGWHRWVAQRCAEVLAPLDEDP